MHASEPSGQFSEEKGTFSYHCRESDSTLNFRRCGRIARNSGLGASRIGFSSNQWAMSITEPGHDGRKFLEAVHFFTVHNLTWRALPKEYGN